MTKKKLKSVKKLGVKGYKKELERQRSPKYKAKRNARLEKKRLSTKLAQLIEKEIMLKVELKDIKKKKSDIIRGLY